MAKRRYSESSPAQPTLRRCRVHTSVCAPQYDYGRTLAPGEPVDLEEPVAPGVILRDLVRDGWFDPPSAPEPPVVEAPSPAPTEEHD